MRHVKPLKLNESLTQKQLIEELKGAKYIIVDFIERDKNWGVTYTKNGEKREEGGFNTNAEVHHFLNDNDIDYGGKGGYLDAKKFRDREISKVPFEKYQRELLTKGLENIFDLS